jgi:hypothetical protein
MVEMADLKKRPHDAGEDALLVPSGTPLYESLSARFLAFDRLIATLGQTGYSGFVRVLGPGVNAILLFRNGKMIDCLWRDSDGLSEAEAGVRKVEALVHSGEAVIDIVELQPEMVDSLHHLASGAPTYPDLFASWVNVEGLVRFLKQRGFTGSVTLKSSAGGGVLMLRRGELLGAFTTGSRQLATDEREVLGLSADPEARIEVRSASGEAHDQRRFEPEEAEPISQMLA